MSHCPQADPSHYPPQFGAFAFEAFDETWKGQVGEEAGSGPHWGIFDVDRAPKPSAEVTLTLRLDGISRHARLLSLPASSIGLVTVYSVRLIRPPDHLSQTLVNFVG